MTKVPNDDVLYCERCGISFLWSIEEQAQEGEKPARCSGCRHSEPAVDRERGLVKWYSARKKYGFIVRADQPEIFAHRSQLQGAGRLHDGDLVEFGVQDSEKGPVAIQIRVVETGLG